MPLFPVQMPAMGQRQIDGGGKLLNSLYYLIYALFQRTGGPTGMNAAYNVNYYPAYGATVTAAVAALPSGGTLHIPAAQSPALPTNYFDVVLEYDGPVTLDNTTANNIGLPLNTHVQRLTKMQEEGSFSGVQGLGDLLSFEAIGSGTGGPASASIAYTIGAYKRNWFSQIATQPAGEVWGANINVRTNGVDGVSTSDATGIGFGVLRLGSSGGVSLWEGSSTIFDYNFSVYRQITVSAGGQSRGSTDDGTGVSVKATGGITDEGVSILQVGGTFTYSLLIEQVGVFAIKPDGSVLAGNATGGFQGAGTINAKGVYDDGVLLACPGLASEFIASKTVDLAKLDAIVPDHITPAFTREVHAKDAKGRLVPDKFEPVHDEDGNGVGALEHPTLVKEHVPEKRAKREHAIARLLKNMVDGGFDPRDPKQYIAKLKADEALPGMPTKDEWEHGKYSMGELQSRAWLAKELLALTVVAQQERLDVMEARLAVLEAECDIFTR